MLTNTTDVGTPPPPQDSVNEPDFDALKIISVAMFVVIAIGLVGNSAVMFIVVRHRDMHTTTNFSFANLALTDFLFLTFHAMSTSLDNVGFRISLLVNCWPTFYLRYVTGEVTCMTLALMSYDRWRVVAYPLDSLRHAARRKKRNLTCICLTWVVSLVMYSPLVVYSVNVMNYYCTIWFPWEHGQKVFHTAAAIVMYVIPLCFISACYLKIFLTLRVSKPGEVENYRGQRSRRMRKTLRLILIVIITFAVSWMLEHLVIVWLVWDPNFLASSPLFTTSTAITKCILYCNSAINPFIYPFAGTGFTKHLSWCGARIRSQ